MKQNQQPTPLKTSRRQLVEAGRDPKTHGIITGDRYFIAENRGEIVRVYQIHESGRLMITPAKWTPQNKRLESTALANEGEPLAMYNAAKMEPQLQAHGIEYKQWTTAAAEENHNRQSHE